MLAQAQVLFTALRTNASHTLMTDASVSSPAGCHYFFYYSDEDLFQKLGHLACWVVDNRQGLILWLQMRAFHKVAYMASYILL